MNDEKLKRTLATITFLTPLIAFAHGEEVLVTMFLEFGLLVGFISSLAFAKIRIAGKLIIGALYLSALAIVDILTRDWPYRENMALINFLVVIIPSTVFLLSYFGLRKRFNKTD
jgi:hypothetical protein